MPNDEISSVTRMEIDAENLANRTAVNLIREFNAQGLPRESALSCLRRLFSEAVISTAMKESGVDEWPGGCVKKLAPQIPAVTRPQLAADIGESAAQ